ncbi:MAG: FixH family protein [Kofleriaceae bacterium]
MSPAAKWLVGICVLLGGNAVAMAALIAFARDGGDQVIPEYYEQASRYDEVVDQAARSRELGWRATAAIEGGAVVVELRDAAGAPIAGARVQVAGHQRAHAGQRYDLALEPVAPGRYRGALATRAGTHDVTATAERDGARFVERLVVEAR